LAASRKVVIDTNVIISVINRELKRGAKEVEDVCRYALEVLGRILDRLLRSLQRLGAVQYIHIIPGQVGELERWLNANVCGPGSDVEREIEGFFAETRRMSKSLGLGFRFSKSSEIKVLQRRLKGFARSKSKQVERQISSLRDEVNRSIAYFALGHGVQGERVKIITRDGELYNVLSTKATELGLQGYIDAIYAFTTEEVSLDRIEAVLRDP